MTLPIPDYPERLAAVASIAAIPAEVLPAPDARDELIQRALAGDDVYAYTSPGGDWIIWIGPDDPAIDGRMSPAEWTARFHASRESGREGGAA